MTPPKKKKQTKKRQKKKASSTKEDPKSAANENEADATVNTEDADILRQLAYFQSRQPQGFSHVVMLGTGCPGPDPERSGPSLAVVVNDRPYIVDFGPGVVRRTAAACERGIPGLAVHLLDRAFLTHLHSDHTLGYPDLIFTPWVCGRETRLQVYGPPGLKHMTKHILKAYEADVDQRLQGLEPASVTGYQVDAVEVEPGKVYEDENVVVEAFEVWHGTWTCYGYKFVCPDRTIVISGDTCKHENVIEAARGCDVLVHEVCSGEGVMWRSPEWHKYHSTYHTLGHELAEIAAEANPRLLVLTHQLFQGVSDADLIREVRQGFSGPVVSAKDLDVF